MPGQPLLLLLLLAGATSADVEGTLEGSLSSVRRKSTQFLIDWRDGDTVESCLSLIMSLGADWKAGGAECDAATLHCCDCHAERPLTVPL
jgi:hypothetical protein